MYLLAAERERERVWTGANDLVRYVHRFDGAHQPRHHRHECAAELLGLGLAHGQHVAPGCVPLPPAATAAAADADVHGGFERDLNLVARREGEYHHVLEVGRVDARLQKRGRGVGACVRVSACARECVFPCALVRVCACVRVSVCACVLGEKRLLANGRESRLEIKKSYGPTCPNSYSAMSNTGHSNRPTGTGACAREAR